MSLTTKQIVSFCDLVNSTLGNPFPLEELPPEFYAGFINGVLLPANLSSYSLPDGCKLRCTAPALYTAMCIAACRVSRSLFPHYFDFCLNVLGFTHFSYKEFTHSGTAQAYSIDNAPFGLKSRISFMHYLEIAYILERFRTRLANRPLCVTSGYRCFRVNRLVGGAKNSYHTRFCAVDIAVSASDAACLKSCFSEFPFLEFIVGDGYLHIAI